VTGDRGVQEITASIAVVDARQTPRWATVFVTARVKAEVVVAINGHER
jgi:hypothetical protein